MGMLHDTGWHVSVDVPGERDDGRPWWVHCPAGQPPDVTRDRRIAAQVIDPALAPMLVDTLNERRGRHGLRPVALLEVRLADE